MMPEPKERLPTFLNIDAADTGAFVVIEIVADAWRVTEATVKSIVPAVG